MQTRILLNNVFFSTLFGLSLFVSVCTTPKPTAQSIPDFPILAGDQLRNENNCNWASGIDWSVYCQTFIDGHEVHYVRDLRTNVITSISYKVQGLRLGDLLLAWGEPTAQTRCGGLRRIWWNTRSVVVNAGRFTPQSRVWYISFSSETGEGESWHGFRR